MPPYCCHASTLTIKALRSIAFLRLTLQLLAVYERPHPGPPMIARSLPQLKEAKIHSLLLRFSHDATR